MWIEKRPEWIDKNVGKKIEVRTSDEYNGEETTGGVLVKVDYEGEDRKREKDRYNFVVLEVSDHFSYTHHIPFSGNSTRILEIRDENGSLIYSAQPK